MRSGGRGAEEQRGGAVRNSGRTALARRPPMACMQGAACAPARRLPRLRVRARGGPRPQPSHLRRWSWMRPDQWRWLRCWWTGWHPCPNNSATKTVARGGMAGRGGHPGSRLTPYRGTGQPWRNTILRPCAPGRPSPPVLLCHCSSGLLGLAPPPPTWRQEPLGPPTAPPLTCGRRAPGLQRWSASGQCPRSLPQSPCQHSQNRSSPARPAHGDDGEITAWGA